MTSFCNLSHRRRTHSMYTTRISSGILQVPTATYDWEHVAARCDTPDQHPTATATVESQSSGVTTSSESKRRGFQTHIDRLPNEILCEIFHIVHGVDGWMTRTALNMGQVCRRWRYIVTGTGSFWTDVRSSQPVDLARLSVERSQQASLKFILAEEPSSPGNSEYHLQARGPGIFPETSVSLLIASIGRIRELVVTLRPETYSTLLLRLASLSAPHLETLHLAISAERFIENHTAQAPFNVAEDLTSRHLLEAPSLTKLLVQTHRLRGELSIYPNINSLTLRLGAGGSHDSSFILGTMRAHEKLTDFLLTFYGPLDIDMRKHDTKVQLLHLNYLSLEVGELEDAGYLLRRMEIPEISQVELDLGTRNPITPTDAASRLATVIEELPSTLREIPMNIAFDRLGFALIILLREHLWSPPAVAIRLRWCGSLNRKLVRSSIESLTPILPRLRMGSCGDEHWTVGRKNVDK